MERIRTGLFIMLAFSAIGLCVVMSGCSAIGPSDTTTTSTVTSSTTSTTTVSGKITGKVYDHTNQPAVGVSVTVRNIAVATGASVKSARTLKAYLSAFASGEYTTTSGAGGDFSINVPDGTYNAEADQSDQYKVIKQNIIISGGNSVDLGTLTLAQTGAISGNAFFADVSNHLGIDVFIPGTSFVAKTAANGSYTILYIPAGTFELDATYTNYKLASLEGVPVVSGSLTTAPNLVLYPEAGGIYGGVTIEARDLFTGNKLPTVEVTIGHVSKTTDSNGIASFDRVWAANQYYSASKEGWNPYSGIIDVVANSTVTETIWLTKESFAITTWGSEGTGEGQFREPMDIAIDTEGNIYVAESLNKRIQ